MINGVDDLLAEKGPEAVLELFDQAAEPSQQRSQNQAQLLVELTGSIQLFHTPDGDACTHPGERPPGDVGSRTKAFRGWLAKAFYENVGNLPELKRSRMR